jgi:hypothetical protein
MDNRSSQYWKKRYEKRFSELKFPTDIQQMSCNNLKTHCKALGIVVRNTHGHADLVKNLLELQECIVTEKYGSWKERMKRQYTNLVVGIQDYEFVELCIQYGVDVNMKENDLNPLLYNVLLSGCVELVKLFLKAGAHIHSKDESFVNRNRPIHIASYGYKDTKDCSSLKSMAQDIIILLLDYGADLASKNVMGITAADILGEDAQTFELMSRCNRNWNRRKDMVVFLHNISLLPNKVILHRLMKFPELLMSITAFI